MTNPAQSAAQYRLAQAVLSGSVRKPTSMTPAVAREIVDSTPAALRSTYSRNQPLAFVGSLGSVASAPDTFKQAGQQLSRVLPGRRKRNLFGFGKQTTFSSKLMRQAYQSGYRGSHGHRGDDQFDSWIKAHKGSVLDSGFKSRLRDEYRRGMEDFHSRATAKEAVKEARGEGAKSAGEYKGHKIMRQDGEYIVPDMDRDSRFESMTEAKRFIKANPKRNGFGEPTGFRKASAYYYVSVEGGSHGLGLDQFTGSWDTKEEADKAAKQIRARGYIPKITKSKRNPADSAAAVYEDFHGHPPDEDAVIETDIEEHTTLAGVGELVWFYVRCEDEEGEYDVRVEDLHGAILSMNEKAGQSPQLYIEGGNQSVNCADFGITAPLHEFETLGRMVCYAYHTTKDHLGEDGGDSDYIHVVEPPLDYDEFQEWELSELDMDWDSVEEETKDSIGPDVIYDTRNRLLMLSGGSYRITREGVVD